LNFKDKGAGSLPSLSAEKILRHPTLYMVMSGASLFMLRVADFQKDANKKILLSAKTFGWLKN